jgi:hypothetical protein
MFNGTIYSTPEFGAVQRFSRKPIAISPDGESVGFNEAVTWCIASVRDTGSCIRQGAGRLVALSSTVAVVDTGTGIEFVDLKTSAKLFNLPKPNCLRNATALESNLVAVSACGDARVLTPDGLVRLDLGQFVLGYDGVASDASGAWLLVSHPHRTVSISTKALEIAQAVATLGMGVADEPPNVMNVRVIDTRSRRVLLEESVNFVSPDNMPTTAISSDGSRIAIANGDTLRILRVPKTH